eukprot:scpid18252/ scgid25972/ Mediator of RNA polymerase II transcription subunit 23; Cofactor required for Sp1 transcriptional activation subunit 3; Mediator complex subunit 23; Protein sur-2 homolog
MTTNQTVQGDDPIGKLKTYMTEVMNPHQYTIFSGSYVKPWSAKEAETVTEIEQTILKLPSDNMDTLLSAYIRHLTTCRNHTQVEFFFSLLPILVKKHMLNAKTLCNALITYPPFESERVWCVGLRTLKSEIKAVDYKGCRDLLQHFLSRITALPRHMPFATEYRVTTTIEVLKYLLDRDVCLLPAYMAQTEIALKYKSPAAHWILDAVLPAFHLSFRPLVDAISMPGRCYLRPVISTSASHNYLWKVQVETLEFPRKGALPFDKEVSMPQKDFLIQVFRQPFSRDMVMHILSLEKKPTRYPTQVLEDLSADAVIRLMEESESMLSDDLSIGELETRTAWLEGQWHHMSCLLTYFPLHGFVVLSNFTRCLFEKLRCFQGFRKSRTELMWLLLQVCGNALSHTLEHPERIVHCIDIFNLLFREHEPLPVPDAGDTKAAKKMAAASFVVLLIEKLGEKVVKRPVPKILVNQVIFIKSMVSKASPGRWFDSYLTAVVMNAASLQQEPHLALVSGFGDQLTGPPSAYSTPPHGTPPTKPCSLAFLDSLTVHVRVSLLVHLVGLIGQHSAQYQRGLPPSPALLETYCRLLHSLETESFGIKLFHSTVLSTVFRHRSMPTLNALIEMVAYHIRLHHVQPHYRTNLLANIFQETTMGPGSSNQLFLNVEAAALRLIASCACAEMHKEFGRLGSDIKLFVISDGDELNRSLALTVARGLHVSGCDRHASAWVDVIMRTLQNSMNFTWSEQVLRCMPQSLQDYFPLCATQLGKLNLLEKVEKEEWPAFQAMSAEAAVSHFKVSTSYTFFCLMWKQLLETGCLTTVYLRVIESITPLQISHHIRTFCDYLVTVHSQKNQNALEELEKSLAAVSDMVWKYDVLPLDKFVLVMVMRNYDTNASRKAFFIVQLLLLKNNEFRKRVNFFVKTVSPYYWLAEDSYVEHHEYLQTFPENLRFEGLARAVGEIRTGEPALQPYLGNVCLRFLPVFDLLIHRMMEMLSVTGIEKSLITILDHLGQLYRFHDQPVLFLYSTLHYYENALATHPHVKKKMVAAVINAQQLCRPKGWCLSTLFQNYLLKAEPATANCWVPPLDYYTALLVKLVETFQGHDTGFPHLDWRFVEFSNSTDLAVHCTCLELLALPCDGERVVTDLLEAMIANVMKMSDEESVISWINAVASVLVMLPETYWGVLMNRIIDCLHAMAVEEAAAESTVAASNGTPMEEEPAIELGRGIKVNLLGWSKCTKPVVIRWRICLTMARCFWHHSTIGQLSGLPDVVRHRLKPVVKTERQFLFVLQMLGPSLQRMNEERTRCLIDLVQELHRMLLTVDKQCKHLDYLDMFCDYLYHLKYMYVGEHSKEKLEEVFNSLRPSIQARLRFMMNASR